MIQTATRPFTDAEREEVEKQLLKHVSEPHWDVPNALWGAFLGFIFGAVSSIVIMLAIEGSHIWGAAIIVVSVLTGIVLGWQGILTSRDTLSDGRRQYAAILARRLTRGEMEELTVSASGVVRVEDGNGEGDGYFFDVGDNKVMYLTEGTLWYAAEDASPEERDAETYLPSAFRLKRYPDATYEAAHIESLGPLLTPQRTLRVESMREEYYGLTDGEVIEGVALATLESDLPFLLGPSAGA
jgi:hypothetical protein